MGKLERRLDTLQTVELAEGMEIHLRIAGPFLRLYAYLLDLVVMIAAVILIWIVIGISSFALGGNVAVGLINLALFVLLWFYPVFFEVSRKGATPGKMVLGLRVVNEAGGTLTFGASMVRNFVRIVEMIFPFLPLFSFLNPRFQRLGDLAAGSLVVYTRDRQDPVYLGPPASVSYTLPMLPTKRIV